MNTAPLYVGNPTLFAMNLKFPVSASFIVLHLKMFSAYALLRILAFMDKLTGIPLPLGLGVDYAVTAASVAASAYADKDTGILGEAGMTAGMYVYKNAADSNRLYKADANLSLAASKVVGCLLSGGGIGQPATYVKKDPFFTPGIPLTAGDIAILSATPGLIAPVADLAAGYFPVVLGCANSVTQMNFNPTGGGVVK